MKDERKFEIEKSILDGTKQPKDYMAKRSEYLYALDVRRNMNKQPETETKQPEMKPESQEAKPETKLESSNPETETVKELNDINKLEEKPTPQDIQLQEKIINTLDKKNIQDLNNPSKDQNKNKENKSKKEKEEEDINSKQGAKIIMDAIVDFEKSHHLPIMKDEKKERMTGNLAIVFDRYLPNEITHYFPELMLGIDSTNEILDIATYIKENPHPKKEAANNQANNTNANSDNKKPETESKQPETKQPEPPRRNNEPNVNGWNVNELREAIARGGGNPDTFRI